MVHFMPWHRTGHQNLQPRVTFRDADADQQPKSEQEVAQPTEGNFNEEAQLGKLKECLRRESKSAFDLIECV